MLLEINMEELFKMLTSERDQLIKVIQEAKQLIDNSNK
jgi:hypothetical protein